MKKEQKVVKFEKKIMNKPPLLGLVDIDDQINYFLEINKDFRIVEMKVIGNSMFVLFEKGGDKNE